MAVTWVTCANRVSFCMANTASLCRPQGWAAAEVTECQHLPIPSRHGQICNSHCVRMHSVWLAEREVGGALRRLRVVGHCCGGAAHRDGCGCITRATATHEAGARRDPDQARGCCGGYGRSDRHG